MGQELAPGDTKGGVPAERERGKAVMVQGVGLEYEKYNDLKTGSVRQTRVGSANLEWVLQSQGNVQYFIRFDSNFAKKHLYTSTKKAENVKAKYDELASEPDVDKRRASAQMAADEAKFKNQLAHRTPAQQKCSTPGCGHKMDEHAGGSGACTVVRSELQFPKTPPPPGQKAKKQPTAVPCPCVKFASVYADKRLAQGKPTSNPLVGATGLTCDAIWMNKIDAKHFEKVVVQSIIDRAASLGSTPWAADGEHVEWDFGASNAGCVIKVADKGTLQEWVSKGYHKVTVTIKLDNTDAKKPVYSVCHLDGKKTA